LNGTTRGPCMPPPPPRERPTKHSVSRGLSPPKQTQPTRPKVSPRVTFRASSTGQVRRKRRKALGTFTQPTVSVGLSINRDTQNRRLGCKQLGPRVGCSPELFFPSSVQDHRELPVAGMPPHLVASSGFLNLSTRYSLCDRPGLFHPGATPGVLSLQRFSPASSWTPFG
jgi:hypothetical protein